MDTFAARLKHYREAAGLTQSELASLINSSQGAVGNWESGARQSAKADVLHAIARALGVEPQVLLGEGIHSGTHLKAEMQLLAVFRSLNSQQQALAVRLLKALRVE